MRVAMALDNTGSMAEDGRMPAMQKAAKDLVDQLSKLAKHVGDSYVSIVPFARGVNCGVDAAGNSNANKRWIDWSLWDTAHGNWGSCGSPTRPRSTRARRSCATTPRPSTSRSMRCR